MKPSSLINITILPNYERLSTVKVGRVRPSQPPNTESCAVRGGSGSERGCRDRTIIVKRRQGTVQTARRSRNLLKLFSLESNRRVCGEVVMETKPNMVMTVNGKDMISPAGSERVVCTERDDRNLGGLSASSHWLPASQWRGRFGQRKKTNRRVSPARGRGDSDHPILGRGKMASAVPNRLKGVTGQRSPHTETYPGEKGPDTRKGLIYL